MFFIYNFLYTLVFSLPIVLLSPQDVNHREIRTEKQFSIGIIGAEYRPDIIESFAGNIGLGINWDPRYIVFDDVESIGKDIKIGNRDSKIEADKANKWNFYINYYLKEDSSFFIGFVLNLIRVQLHLEAEVANQYGTREETNMLDFYANYFNYGIGVGWHCIWEGGVSILVGIDLTTTNHYSSTKVEHKSNLFTNSSVKQQILEKYENKDMFPISSKFMIGYSF